MRVTAECLHAVDLVSSSVVDNHIFQFNLSLSLSVPLSSQSKVALFEEALQKKTEVVFLVLVIGYQSFVPRMYTNKYKLDILWF